VVTLERAVVVECPIDDVFAYLTDLARLPEWQSSISEVHVDGRVEEGTRFVETREFMGRRVRSTLEVAAFEPSRRFMLRTVEGPLRFEVDHRLEDRNGQTYVAISARAKLPGLFGFAARPLMKGAERELRGDLERLKRRLESG
jgi:uncharacterized membrane protein